MATNRRNASIGIRTLPEIGDALRRAADERERSVSWLIERIAREWLEAEGYLPAADRKIFVRDRVGPAGQPGEGRRSGKSRKQTAQSEGGQSLAA